MASSPQSPGTDQPRPPAGPRGARPWSVVAAVVAVTALALAVGLSVAAGILALACLVAAVLRLAAPGWSPVRVRTRLLDALTLGTFAGALAYLALTAPLG